MKEMTRADVIAILQDEIRKTGSQKVVAYRLGVSAQYLSDILRWKPISQRVLDALGLKEERVYASKDDARVL